MRQDIKKVKRTRRYASPDFSKNSGKMKFKSGGIVPNTPLKDDLKDFLATLHVRLTHSTVPRDIWQLWHDHNL